MRYASAKHWYIYKDRMRNNNDKNIYMYIYTLEKSLCLQNIFLRWNEYSFVKLVIFVFVAI